MVVRDLDVRRAFRRPNKAYPELVIDTDRVLTLAISRKRLKPVARRRPQVGQIARSVQVAQFRRATLTQSAGKPFGLSPWKTASVDLFRKRLIITRMYHKMIHTPSGQYRSLAQANFRPFVFIRPPDR